MAYFPIFINLENQDCLVVGGGKVAERKVRILLEYGPKIRVVAPEVTETLRKLQAEGRVRLFLRPFCPEDLKEAFLVIAASSDPDVNREISKVCKEKKIPVNVVDVKEECSFLFPALIKEENVTIGISTGGDSPAMAGFLKEKIRKSIPENCGQTAAWMGEKRKQLKGRIPDLHLREAIFKELAREAMERGKGLSRQEVDEIINRKMEQYNE